VLVDAERVALVQMVVEQGGEHVVRGRDGMEVAGEVQVQRLHRHHLGVAAARGAALDTERRPHRRLPDRHRGALADVPHRLAEPHRRGGLALAERGRSDRGYQHVLGPRPVGQLFDRGQLELRDLPPVRSDQVRPDPHPGGDVGQRVQRRSLRDRQVGRECPHRAPSLVMAPSPGPPVPRGSR
jgi:hypothetical protein